jgi:hypothetical protein
MNSCFDTVESLNSFPRGADSGVCIQSIAVMVSNECFATASLSCPSFW